MKKSDITKMDLKAARAFRKILKAKEELTTVEEKQLHWVSLHIIEIMPQEEFEAAFNHALERLGQWARQGCP